MRLYWRALLKRVSDMSDEIDKVNDHVQFLLDHEIAKVRVSAKPIEATGECLSCGEGLDSGKRWCNADCRDEWQREQKSKRRHCGHI